MKKIATACALLALSISFEADTTHAQVQKPSVEYAAIWDAQMSRWKDTAQTFQMSYSPEYSVVQRSGQYRTTYSGFTPVTGEVYQTRFYWEPGMAYSSAQVDSVHDDGIAVTPIRLDQYDRTSASKTTFTRSFWNGSAWIPTQTSVSLSDDQGIPYSQVNHVLIAGTLTLADSTHLNISRDFKGNVTGIKVYHWSSQEPTLQPVSEQRYTLNGDGSIASAEVWVSMGGPELTRSMRLHAFDWAIRDKSFPYVSRDEGMDLYYGGDGWRSAKVDIWNGADWSEMYLLEQTFDEEDRLRSYTFNGMTRDTFAFDQGLLSLSQSDALMSNVWTTNRGNKTVYDRDANGTLRSVTTQRFDAGSSLYVNERLYMYQAGAASVGDPADKIQLAVYPNPASNELTIQSNEVIQSVEILSITGQTLLSSETANLDVSMLIPGAYGVRVSTPKGKKTLKFVKSH